MSQKLSEMLGLVSCIDPDAYSAGTQTGDEVDMSSYHKIVYVLMVGDMVSSATLDYAVQGSATSGGTFATISGKSITQLTQAGTDDNKQAIIEVDAIEVKAAGYRYVKDQLILGTAGADCGAVAFAGPAKYGPASDGDLSTVDEIVS